MKCKKCNRACSKVALGDSMPDGVKTFDRRCRKSYDEGEVKSAQAYLKDLKCMERRLDGLRMERGVVLKVKRPMRAKKILAHRPALRALIGMFQSRQK